METHTGAARITGLRMRPMTLSERGVARDMARAGLSVRRPATVRSWLRAYGAATATDASYEKIRDAATSGRADKPAKTTTLPYIDVLTDLRIVDSVDAWTPGLNHLKRLTRSPKHHLADPPLAARLQGIGRQKLLEGGTGAVEMPRDGGRR